MGKWSEIASGEVRDPNEPQLDLFKTPMREVSSVGLGAVAGPRHISSVSTNELLERLAEDRAERDALYRR